MTLTIQNQVVPVLKTFVDFDNQGLFLVQANSPPEKDQKAQQEQDQQTRIGKVTSVERADEHSDTFIVSITFDVLIVPDKWLREVYVFHKGEQLDLVDENDLPTMDGCLLVRGDRIIKAKDVLTIHHGPNLYKAKVESVSSKFVNYNTSEKSWGETVRSLSLRVMKSSLLYQGPPLDTDHIDLDEDLSQ